MLAICRDGGCTDLIKIQGRIRIFIVTRLLALFARCSIEYLNLKWLTLLMMSYQLRWRRAFLVVKRAKPEQIGVLRLQRDHLHACVKHSSAQAIKLDLDLDYDSLLSWADACADAGKQVYVSLPSALNLPQNRNARRWSVKRLFDKLMAIALLLLLALPMLGLSLLVRRQTSESLLVKEWHLGQRGRLFQTLQFRTQDHSGAWLTYGPWMHRLKLDRLPKVFNVLRGEMSLVGACPRRLVNAAQVDRSLRYRLNALPGLTGAWQFEHRSLLDEVFLNRLDLNYLRQWSLTQDIRMLALTLMLILMSSRSDNSSMLS
jgi:lipopolysaccharide/colanic/teichoic acid biosynthesis glycosyltransferase